MNILYEKKLKLHLQVSAEVDKEDGQLGLGELVQVVLPGDPVALVGQQQLVLRTDPKLSTNLSLHKYHPCLLLKNKS